MTNPSGFTQGVQRAQLAYRVRCLLTELKPWRVELRQDIERARERGMLTLAADLHRLLVRVEQAYRAGEALNRDSDG